MRVAGPRDATAVMSGYSADAGLRYEEFALDAPYLSAMAIGTPGGTRTPDPLLRRQPLCPLSYRRKSSFGIVTRVAKAYHTTGGQWRPLSRTTACEGPAERVYASMLEFRITMNAAIIPVTESILSPQFEH